VPLARGHRARHRPDAALKSRPGGQPNEPRRRGEMPGSRYGAQDLGPFGITAKCITPGVIASGGIMAMVIPGSIQSSRYRAELARVTPARDGRGLRQGRRVPGDRPVRPCDRPSTGLGAGIVGPFTPVSREPHSSVETVLVLYRIYTLGLSYGSPQISGHECVFDLRPHSRRQL
jgi:hypothetical protein